VVDAARLAELLGELKDRMSLQLFDSRVTASPSTEVATFGST
jgi:hypothetical protein